MGVTLLAMFVGFGLLIGILFGSFGMGGSFLVTPALLVMGYEPKVAVGSGLAFVLGTSVIAAFKHRDLGQIDYKVGGLFVLGVTAGIEVGKRGVLLLTDLGLADLVVSVAYVFMLGSVGLFVLRDAWSDERRSFSGDDLPGGVASVRAIRIPPVVPLKGGGEASVAVVLVLAALIGILSELLGVGGGFLLMPALMYGLGVPAAVAVGTDVFQFTLSGAFGAFTYAREAR